MPKRVLFLIIALSIVSFAACSASEPEQEKVEPEASAAQAAESADWWTVDLAVLGDFGDVTGNEGNVAHYLNQTLCPEVIVTVGDNNYYEGSPPSDYNQAVGAYYADYGPALGTATQMSSRSASCPAIQGSTFYPSPGNHDWISDNAYNDYQKYFRTSDVDVDYTDALTACDSQTIADATGYPSFECPGDLDQSNQGYELFYDFVIGPIHFFSINSNCPSDDDHGCYTDPLDCSADFTSMSACAQQICGQRAWLDYAQSKSTAPWKVVYYHQPPYSSGNHGDCDSMKWNYYEHTIDLVLAGHHHAYERTMLQTTDGTIVPYLVNGLGGTAISSKACVKGSMSAQQGYTICSNGVYSKHNDAKAYVGAMRLRASDEKLTTEFIYTRGSGHNYEYGVVDTCTLTKTDGVYEATCEDAKGSSFNNCSKFENDCPSS